MTRIKICCINSIAEAELSIRYGASAVGLVSEMPSGPGVISEELIAEISSRIPPAVSSFLLTSKQKAAEIIAQQRRCLVDTIQLCDAVDLETYAELRAALPGISLVQVVHVVDETAISVAKRAAPYVDGILLDSGNPSLSKKELGGTGRTHDWSISRQIREQIDIPIFLAGGLNPENIAAAIETVQPYGVDVCSGVRTNGRLDVNKLISFMTVVFERSVFFLHNDHK